VDDDNVVVVSPELQQNIFDKQTEMNFVGHIDQLRDHNFLVLLMIDADERGIVAYIKEIPFGFVFHGLAKCVFRDVETQAGIEIAVYAARFLDEVDAASNASFARGK
jgi:hypothetical protein